MQGYIRQIQALLKTKNTEDSEGELLLIKYHLEHTNFSDEEVERIIIGINSEIPIPHIIGYNIICDAKININRDVLNPGPETRTLIEKAIEYIRRLEAPSVLDICSGSGVIGIAIALNIHNSVCIGVDISEKAIENSKKNACENNVNIDFRLGDLFGPVNDRMFDIITANPPYVCSNAIKSLPSYVKDFVPRIAIDGGEDGLLLHRRILERANIFLKPKGVLFLECEDEQDAELVRLFEQYSWHVDDRYINRFGKVRGFRLSLLG